MIKFLVSGSPVPRGRRRLLAALVILAALALIPLPAHGADVTSRWPEGCAAAGLGVPMDGSAPIVVWITPPNGGAATTDAPIRIRFSETMNTRSVEDAFSYGDGYSVYTVGDGGVSWIATESADDTLRFDPRLEFATGGTVTVHLQGQVAKDAEGNLLDGNRDGTGGDDYAWSFPVASDGIPPKVLSTTPAMGNATVSVSTTLRVLFSKAMDRTGVEDALSLAGTGAPTLRIADGSAGWTGSRFPDDTLVFDPSPNLMSGTQYRFVLSGDLAVDRSAVHLDGNGNGTATGSPADDFVLRFTTEMQDLTPPAVVNRTPAADVEGVPPSTQIAAAFSEPMDRSSVEASFSYTDGTSVYGATDGTVTWNPPSDLFSFRASRILSFEGRYTVTLNGSIARDNAGNLLSDGAGETWSFTVAAQPDTTPPYIRGSSPYNAQKNVSRTARVSIVFSEAMDKESVVAAMGITGAAALGDFRWPNDATVDAMTVIPMEYHASYTVYVLTSATDLAGNPLHEPDEIAFTTAAWRGPVTGRVADERGTGIPGARVQLNGFSRLTNETGGFAFESVEQGTYTLTISDSGYDAYTEPVTISPGQGSLGTIALRHSSVSTINPIPGVFVATAIIAALVIGVWLVRRRRSRPTERDETWKAAEVVPVEPTEPGPEKKP